MQQILEQAIGSVTQEPVQVTASGRTDAGAHALEQIIAFSTESRLPVETMHRAFNAHLPSDITVLLVEDTDRGFHPRFDAISRIYRYLIWNSNLQSPFWVGRAWWVSRPLDVAAMDRAVRLLLGQHDFSSFVASSAEGSREREIFRAACWRDGSQVNLEIEGSGFMRQMVRSIAGTLVRVGRGGIDLDEFEAILNSRDRARAGDTAPAEGLYLVRVNYVAATHKHTTPSVDG